MAVRALPEALRRRVRFFVIGQDNPRQFLKLADDLGVDAQLTIFAGRDDVPRFLLGADIMVHPAYMESGGIVLVEALVAGLPVITTNVCGFAHYVEESGGGVVIESPYSQEALNGALAQMVADEDFRHQCAENGVAFGRTADIYRMAEQAADLIEAKLVG